MTVVLGIAHDNGVILGADSGGFGGWDVTVRSDPKVFRLRDDFIVGYTTSFRFGQIVRYHVKPPKGRAGSDAYDVMVRDWIPTVRAALKEHGYTMVKDSRESAGTMMVGWGSRLFTIYDDFQVAESADGIDAIGCGYAYALGAVLAIEGSPLDRVERALEITYDRCCGTRGPSVFIET